MFLRKTIQKEVSLFGIGLHTSEKSSVRLLPAKEQTGIVVVTRGEEIQVTHKTLTGSSLGTNLVGEKWQIRTIEHLLSAIVGLGITDIKIITESPELPILDGSAIDFVHKIREVGVKTMGVHRKVRVTEQIEVNDGQKHICIRPRNDNQIVIIFNINFDNRVVESMPQQMTYIHNEENYFNEIASARTFGFKKDLDFMLSQELALGGSLENAILIDEDKVINKDGLRFEAELVAHKILDIVGDLSPMLLNFTGFTVIANQAGHAINNKALKAFYQSLL